jgi:hypothetical protein
MNRDPWVKECDSSYRGRDIRNLFDAGWTYGFGTLAGGAKEP